MIPKGTELYEKLEAIRDSLRTSKQTLITYLNTKVRDSSYPEGQKYEYFNISQNTSLITILKDHGPHIYSTIKQSSPPTPSNPPQSNPNTLVARISNLKPKIQYCNNLIRYILKKYGIIPLNGNTLNDFSDLVTEFNKIKSTPTFQIYEGGTLYRDVIKKSVYESTDYGTITITTNVEKAQINTEFTITAKYVNFIGQPIANKEIKFYDNGNYIKKATTNSSGIVTVTYTPTTETEADVNLRASTKGTVSPNKYLKLISYFNDFKNLLAEKNCQYLYTNIYNDNGVIKGDKKAVSSITTVQDLNNIIYNVVLTNDTWNYDKFTISNGANAISEEDFNTLKKAFIGWESTSNYIKIKTLE